MTPAPASRPRSVAEAVELVVASVVPLGSERVPLAEAHGRVLAEDAVAEVPVPAFDPSAMDGFAVRSVDTRAAATGAVSLEIVGESRAGHPFDGLVGEGECVRISTGAAVPPGADAVVRVEDAAVGRRAMTLSAPVDAGTDVRGSGDDIRAGETVLAAGAEIGAAELGALASLGRASVPVFERPRVAVLVTGDELIEPDEPARPGAVRNSNRYVLTALVREAGSEGTSVERVGDDRPATVAAIERGLEADVLVISGGVSVGPHDHVKPALAEAGVVERFWRVALRPGHPTWFGTASAQDSPTLVFGLPGNPVSAAVTFDLFVRPALAAMQGLSARRLTIDATLEETYAKQPGRSHYLRLRAELRGGRWYVRPTGPQASHRLTSLLAVDAVALIDADRGTLEAGSQISVQLLPRSLKPAG